MGKKAWYLDEDVLLEGTLEGEWFYPHSMYACGFSAQKIGRDDMGKTLFFDVNSAFAVCGEVPVIDKEAQRKLAEEAKE